MHYRRSSKLNVCLRDILIAQQDDLLRANRKWWPDADHYGNLALNWLLTYPIAAGTIRFLGKMLLGGDTMGILRECSELGCGLVAFAHQSQRRLKVEFVWQGVFLGAYRSLVIILVLVPAGISRQALAQEAGTAPTCTGCSGDTGHAPSPHARRPERLPEKSARKAAKAETGGSPQLQRCLEWGKHRPLYRDLELEHPNK